MFAQLLRDARLDAGLTQEDLAQRSGTSRPTIADYESGRKHPRMDTAERIMNAMGLTLTTARVARAPVTRAVFDRRAVDELMWARATPAQATAEARDLTAEIIESDCAIEGIDLPWGEVKALSEGITIGGEPLQIWRAAQLARSVRATVKRASSGRSPHLRTVVSDTLIEADAAEPDGLRELQYLVTAIAAGADAALTLHAVNGALLRGGFPWLFVPYPAIEAYRRALVAAKRTGDGTALVDILAGGLRGRIR
ncbi:MAG: helix-turn-helix transcriptional regulator [Microbacterium sp.]